MNILFCNNPLHEKMVDIDYLDEWEASKQNNFKTHLFSYEQLVGDKDAELATRNIKPVDRLEEMIYRGWMLKPNQYDLLYKTLLAKNYRLINSAIEYQNCHYLPDSYRFIDRYTPKTIWLKVADQRVDYDKVFNDIKVFGNASLIVKDYVKSQKHYWDTACFIPTTSDRDNVKLVIERLVALQNTDLNEGLVIREFVVLEDLAIHSKSRMPLKQEYRLFFVNRQLLGCYDYWEEGSYAVDEDPPLTLFKNIAANIESNFFSMDIAKTKSGEWLVIELGDGQVAGLPDKTDKVDFYDLMQTLLSKPKSE